MSKIIDQCPVCGEDFMFDPSWDDALIKEVEVNKDGDTQPMYICQDCAGKNLDFYSPVDKQHN